jgi:hypothetical protein
VICFGSLTSKCSGFYHYGSKFEAPAKSRKPQDRYRGISDNKLAGNPKAHSQDRHSSRVNSAGRFHRDWFSLAIKPALGRYFPFRAASHWFKRGQIDDEGSVALVFDAFWGRKSVGREISRNQ